MSTWDQIGAALEQLANAGGGKLQLYKPVVRIEVYGHDDQVSVEVGRCKSMDEVVIEVEVMNGRPWPEALLVALTAANAKAGTLPGPG